MYQVEALNSYGTRGWGTSATVSVNTAYGVVPTPVPTLSVPGSSSTGSATVSWTAAAPVTGYTLQQSSNGGTTWSTVYSGTGTSTSLSNLGNGSYTYQVQACNDTAGDSVCTAWATGGPLVVTHPPASAPGLSVPGASNTGSYTVSWSAVSTATSYTLQQSVNGGGWTTVYSGAGTSFGLSGEGNGTYAYQVQACNVGGCSGWSGTGTTTVTHPPASAPSLSVPGSSSTGSYTVSWGGVSTATSYTLQQSANGGGWSTIYSGVGTSDGRSGIGDGTYRYQVQACNVGGCGPWSASGTITVALVPVLPSSPLRVTVSGTTYKPVINVSWSAIPNATAYNLEMNEPATGTATTLEYSGSGNAWSSLFLYSGQVNFRLQACNSVGCTGWSAYKGVVVHG